MSTHPLKDLLERRSVPLVELARELRVDPSTVSHKLAGRRGWSAEEAVQVVDFLQARGIRASIRALFRRKAKRAA